MYAFEIPGLRFSLPAGEAIPMNRFISVGTNSKGVKANATTPVIGVSMNAVETGDGVAASQQIVEIADGIVVVEAGAAISVGANVSSNADGKAIPAVAMSQDATSKAVTAGTPVAGIAITSASASGELITVKLV